MAQGRSFPRLPLSNSGGVDRKENGQLALGHSKAPPKSPETVRERLRNWGGVKAQELSQRTPLPDRGRSAVLLPVHNDAGVDAEDLGDFLLLET
jgi:hypothetical protein